MDNSSILRIARTRLASLHRGLHLGVSHIAFVPTASRAASPLTWSPTRLVSCVWRRLQLVGPALFVGLVGWGVSCAEAGTAVESALTLRPSTALAPMPAGAPVSQRPIVLRADALLLRPELDAVAEGGVEFRRAGTLIRADRLSYDSGQDRASALGQVWITRAGMRYSGPELQLKVERFEGFFLQPEFEFSSLGAGGRADRIDFLDSDHMQLTNATYTSCSVDGSGTRDRRGPRT